MEDYNTRFRRRFYLRFFQTLLALFVFFGLIVLTVYFPAYLGPFWILAGLVAVAMMFGMMIAQLDMDNGK